MNRTFAQTPVVWSLVALILLSAGHGIVLHHEHDHGHEHGHDHNHDHDHGHDNGPEECALCVLGWTSVLSEAAASVAAGMESSKLRANERDLALATAFAHSRSQRAPPR